MRFKLLSCIILLYTIQLYAQKPQSRVAGEPEMTFELVEHDFGNVPENGGKVSCEYVFTNTGNCPLIIRQVVVSCKCVNVDFSKKPVPAGEKGSIIVTYNPRKQEGVFYKAIQIFPNTRDGRHIIVAKGVVVPRR